MSAIMFAVNTTENRRRYRDKILCRKARRPCLPFFGGNVNFFRESVSEDEVMLDLEEMEVTLSETCFSETMTTGFGIDIVVVLVEVTGVALMESVKARLSILPFPVNGNSWR